MFPLSDSIKARRLPFINLILIAVNVYVFFQQITSVSQDILISKYAFIPSLINFSDFSTLTPFVTAIFLHGGILHIVSNMWFLWVFGDNVEGYTGWFFYPLIFLFSGIVGNLLQYLFMTGSSIPMLGASGAVAGVLGAYFVLFPKAQIRTLIPIFGFPSVINISSAFMLGYWFLLQIISGATSIGMSQDVGGVAFWAHVGGFVTGLVFGKLLQKKVEFELES
ncbi:MAG: rhomboid family intramembrane serine protease [Candidatus Levybacteria bacterium]|nr:rhomboid family intramembrane serine protease [Candidatus Levybacteria bacterium]